MERRFIFLELAPIQRTGELVTAGARLPASPPGGPRTEAPGGSRAGRRPRASGLGLAGRWSEGEAVNRDLRSALVSAADVGGRGRGVGRL